MLLCTSLYTIQKDLQVLHTSLTILYISQRKPYSAWFYSFCARCKIFTLIYIFLTIFTFFTLFYTFHTVLYTYYMSNRQALNTSLHNSYTPHNKQSHNISIQPYAFILSITHSNELVRTLLYLSLQSYDFYILETCFDNSALNLKEHRNLG